MNSKLERDAIISSNKLPMWRHSQNQEVMKRRREGERKAYGDKKASKANLRRRKKEQLLENEQLWEDQQSGMRLLKSRRQWELSRALGHVFVEGIATPQEMDIIDRKGEVLKRYTIPEVIEDLPELIITIVDFTSQRKQ